MGSEFEYDLITLGAGSGGTRASRLSAAIYKKKVAIIELPYGPIASDTMGGAGGTCVIRGCVPKKLMVYGSEFAEEFHDSKSYGWTGIEPEKAAINWKHMVEQKDKEILRLNKIYNNLLKNSGCEFIEGFGRVTGPNSVEVSLPDGSKRQLTAKHILVAVGGKAQRVPIPGSEHTIISDDALVLDEFPSRGIVVLGAGYIAVEFAGIFRGFGAPVHLMYRKELPLRGFDTEVREQVAGNLKLKGIQLQPNCTPTRVEKVGEGHYVLYYKDKGDEEERSMEASIIMMATGRKPRTEGLGLEAVGVDLESKSGAIKVDPYSRTSVPSIWAVGDVTDRMNLTPVALMESKALVRTLWEDEPTVPDYREVPTAVFCQPPIGTVGLTEEQAVECLSGDIDVYTSRFRALKHTLTGRQEKTFMKMLVHVPTDRVVGVHMVGDYAGEIMTPIAVAIKCGATKRQFDETVGVHPSSSEEFVTMSSKTRTVQGRGPVMQSTPAPAS